MKFSVKSYKAVRKGNCSDLWKVTFSCPLLEPAH